MKAKFVITAFIGILSLAGSASAQHVRVFSGNTEISPSSGNGGVWKTLSMDLPADTRQGRTIRLAFKEVDNIGGQGHGLEFISAAGRGASRIGGTVVIHFTGLEAAPDLQFYEAVIPARTREACLASRDFSSAVPIGPDRAYATFDPVTGRPVMVWDNLKQDQFQGAPTCRVLLAVSASGSPDADGADFLVWQRNFGGTL